MAVQEMPVPSPGVEKIKSNKWRSLCCQAGLRMDPRRGTRDGTAGLRSERGASVVDPFYQVKGLSLPPFSEELEHTKMFEGTGSVPGSVHKATCILK